MKRALVIGSINAVANKDIFPLIKDKRLWLGVSSLMYFKQPDGSKKRFGNITWFTNLDHQKRNTPITLTKTYNPTLYPKYDNFDAINVNSTADIPKDYDGIMGVPLTFINKYCPSQFEIIWRCSDIEWCKNECTFFTPPTPEKTREYQKQDKHWFVQNPYLVVNEKAVNVYKRIFIQRKTTKFIVLGNKNSIACKDIFPLIRDNKIWLGTTVPNDFIQPDADEKKSMAGLTRWYTNVEHRQHNTPLALNKTYSPEEYPTYDNYDAINVNSTAEIPKDYKGVMGVPLTFMDKYCPSQFKIIGIACGNSWANYPDVLKSLNFNPNIKYGGGLGSGVINGKAVYTRILISQINFVY